MNINQHNYETFFLLYVDNELSAAERKLVEDFVQSSADLQEELVMLQQSILIGEDIVFEDKTALYKRELSPSETQEKLLLHLDNELSLTDSAALKEMIHSNEAIKKEWDILQQTKLVPDTAIIFADKRSLYRRKKGKVVALPWMKLAVAAVFIGFVLWGGIVYINNNNGGQDQDVVTNDKKQNIKKAADENPPPENLPAEKQLADKLEVVIQEPVKVPPSTIKAKAPGIKPVEKLRSMPKREQQQIAVQNPTNNLPEPYFNSINKSEGNKTITASVPPQKQANKITDPGNPITETSRPKVTETTSSFALTASLPEAAEENDNRILFMDEDKAKKTKLGGFLRKAKRVLERNTKIKNGSNHLKVANLEFAIQ